jgi:hypothetical protein
VAEAPGPPGAALAQDQPGPLMSINSRMWIWLLLPFVLLFAAVMHACDWWGRLLDQRAIDRMRRAQWLRETSPCRR